MFWFLHIWQILKHFSGVLSWVQILKLRGVYSSPGLQKNSWVGLFSLVAKIVCFDYNNKTYNSLDLTLYLHGTMYLSSGTPCIAKRHRSFVAVNINFFDIVDICGKTSMCVVYRKKDNRKNDFHWCSIVGKKNKPKKIIIITIIILIIIE